jgi:acetyl-CoA acetyltransferase
MQAFQRVPRHLDLSDLDNDDGRAGTPADTSRPAAAETRSGLPRRVRGQHLARDLREPRPARATGEGYRRRDADAEREQLDAFATASRRGAAAAPADHERTS